MAREGAKVVVTDYARSRRRQRGGRDREAAAPASFFSAQCKLEEDWIKWSTEPWRNTAGSTLLSTCGDRHPGNAEDASFADCVKSSASNLDGSFLEPSMASADQARSKGWGNHQPFLDRGIGGDPDPRRVNASKAASAFSLNRAALRCAGKQAQVFSSTLSPAGLFWTRWSKMLRASEAKRKALVALHPVGHLGEPDDIDGELSILPRTKPEFITGRRANRRRIQRAVIVWTRAGQPVCTGFT